MPSVSRWQILLKVMPLTMLFCLAKYGVHQLGWETWEFDSLTGALFGAATFVVALVLSGTLSDYRTSEVMPTQIANSLETIHDTNLAIAAGHPDHNPQPLQEGLLRVAKTIDSWLTQGQDEQTVIDALTDLNRLFVPLAQLGGGAIANRVHTEQAKVRMQVAQIKSNRDTDFLGPAYVLLWLFLVGAIVALLLINANQFSKNLIVSAFMFTSFIYLLLLIRDLDNPFQYDGKSSVDVDLSPLRSLSDRLIRSSSQTGSIDGSPIEIIR